jgi:hypothetical protein
MQPLDRMNAHPRRGPEAMPTALRRRSFLDSAQDVSLDEAAGGWSFVPERRT